MNILKVHFPNSRNETLTGKIYMPANGKPLAFAMFAHCFTCGKNLSAISNISRALALQGVAMLSFDFTGLGESEGDFSETSFSHNIDDLLAAADFLAQEYQSPKILIGHSLGGAAIIHVAGQISSVLALVTIGTPAHPAHVRHLLQNHISAIREDGEAEVNIGGRPFCIREDFVEDLRRHNTSATLNDLNRALLIFHSPQDKIVGIDNAAEIYNDAMHPKSFVSLNGADHLLSNSEDSKYVGNVIAAWAMRYVEVLQPSHTGQLPLEKQVAARTEAGSFLTIINAGGHGLVADEPEDAGGTDQGATPYGLLLAALGSCTSMTLRMYADRKNWPLEATTVHLSHESRHANDCNECEKDSARIAHIEREIAFQGDLTDDQRKRLLLIANKCPVHRTLEGKIHIETTMKNQG